MNNLADHEFTKIEENSRDLGKSSARVRQFP